MKSEKDNFKRGTTEFLVLYLLTKEDMYGYQIIQTMKDKSNGEYILLEGSLYLVLLKLENDGYVKGNVVYVGQKRKRKYYSITDTGKNRFKVLIAEYDRICSGVNKILDR